MLKAVVQQDSFNKGLVLVSKIAISKGQLPVLANVLLEALKEEVVLSVTNLEIGIRVRIGGKVEETGAITIPARILSEFVTTLPMGGVELEEHEGKLAVKSGKFGGKFAGISASEFPVMPKFGSDEKDGLRFKISRKNLEQIANEVAFSAALDESRPVLTGVQFRVVGEGLVVTATDGFRLSRKTIEGGGVKMKALESVILPARTIIELTKLVAEGKASEIDVQIVKDNNQVLFGYEQTELISRVLEGNFPDVDKIIPKEGKLQLTVDREELIKAVRAISIFARENSNILKLNIDNGKLTIVAVGGQTGEGEVEVEIEKTGENETMAFNFKYLLDFLNSVNEERVELSTNGGLTPGVWAREKDKSLIHLIMPVKV